MAPASLESRSGRFVSREARTEFLSLLGGEKKEISIVIVYSIFIALLSLFVPIGVQAIVNTVAFGNLLQPVLVVAGLVFLGISASGILELTRFWIVEIIQQRLFVRVSISLAYRISRMCHTVFRDEFAPELVNRFFEVVIVQKSLAKLALDGIAIIIQATVGLILLSFYHPYFLIYALALICSYGFVLFLPMKRAIFLSSKECSSKHSVLIWLENIASAPLIFKSLQGRAFGEQVADAFTLDYLRNRNKHFRVLFAQNVGFSIIQALGTAAVLGLGGYLVVIEEISLGQLVAAELIVGGILAGMSKTGRLIESYYDLMASLQKLDSLAQLPLEQYQGDELTVGESGALSVSVKNVMLGFPQSGNVLSGINLEVDAGESVAIYGDNGSGKSILAECLMKFHTPTAGSIKLATQNLKDVNPESIRNKVVLIRKLEIFRGTVEENLRLGNTDLSNAAIRDVLTSVGLRETFERLPDGLRTKLGENGRPLSSGQARRLMIARAILLQPRLLIIDESLDSLDSTDLQNYIIPTLTRKGAAPWTLIVLTHDRLLARKFERTMVLEDGVLKAE